MRSLTYYWYRTLALASEEVGKKTMGTRSAGIRKLAFYDSSPNHKLKLWYLAHARLNLRGGLRIGQSGSVLSPVVPFLVSTLLSESPLSASSSSLPLCGCAV